MKTVDLSVIDWSSTTDDARELRKSVWARLLAVEALEMLAQWPDRFSPQNSCATSWGCAFLRLREHCPADALAYWFSSAVIWREEIQASAVELVINERIKAEA